MIIRGNTVGTPMPRTDWNQTNPHKSDYLKGRENLLTLIDEKFTEVKNTATQNASDIQDLGVSKAETATYHGTFTSSGWSSAAPFTQTITVSGIRSTDYPFVDIDLSNVSDAAKVIEGWTKVGRCTVSSANKVIAYCYEEKPTVNIPIIFKVVR